MEEQHPSGTDRHRTRHGNGYCEVRGDGLTGRGRAEGGAGLDGEERGAEEEHPGEEPRDDGGAAPAPRRRLLLLLRLRRLRLGLHRHFVSGRRDVHPHCRPRNDSL